MNKCENPLCGRTIPANRRFCSGCGNAVRQRRHRERHRRPGKGTQKLTPSEIIARATHLKERPLLTQQKQLVGSAQKPPAESRELTDAVAAERERQIAECESLKQRINLMVRWELSARNVRAVYLAGLPFKVAVMPAREQTACLRQRPGLDISAPCDIEFTQRYLRDLFSSEELRCRHGALWHEQCDLCDVDVESDLSGADTKTANAILAKLGFSVWAGKQPGHLTAGSVDWRNDEGERQGKRKRPTGNAPDSFEPRGEKAPPGAGQAGSKPDPDYAGKRPKLGRAAGAALRPFDVPFEQDDGRTLENADAGFDQENRFDRPSVKSRGA